MRDFTLIVIPMQRRFRRPQGRTLLAAVVLAVLLGVSAPHAGAGPVSGISQSGPYAETPPRYLSPFPVVRILGSLTNNGARILLLRVKAPRGTKIKILCGGGRRLGCPYRSRGFTVRSNRIDIRSMHRRLRGGVRLRIYVRRGGTVGKYTAFRIRVGRSPARADACLFPGSDRPRGCP